MKLITKLLVLLTMMTMSATAFAQVKVSGTVIDSEGEPIIGASVMENGTSNGVATDLDGNFTVTVASDKSVLVVSYIGFTTQKLPVGSKRVFNIKMSEDSKMLEDVVVVGYGTQKRATLTGAVSMVNGDDVLKKRSSSNIAAALQGTIPGLTITRGSSRPSSTPSISLRGGISVNTATPLILIDGVDAYTWELNELNPNDIESISVLKDAAASIYGARAAGGVILVTTKRAKTGKAKVTYNGGVTANFVGKKYPAATGSEWARMMLMADQNDTNHPAGASTLWNILGFNREAYERVMNNEAFDWTNGSTTYRIDPLNANQVDAVYGTTWGTSHNPSVTAGSETVKSVTSLGYSNDRSLIKVVYDGQRKYNFRNNSDFQIGKYLKIETGISYDNKYERYPLYGIGYGLQDFWIFPLYTQSGQKFYDNFGGNNVLSHLVDGGVAKCYQNMIRLSGKATVDLSFLSPVLKGLSVYAKGSYRQFWLNKQEQGHKVQNYDYYTDEITNNAAVGSRSKTEQFWESNTRGGYQLYEYFLNYDRTFGKHHVNALFGNTNELRDDHSTKMYRKSDSPVSLFDLNVYDGTTDRINSSSSYKWSYVSLVSRVNYDYAGRYLIEGSWRHDGSSRLVKKNRWQDFFAVSAGWRISDEKFMQNIDWISNLKIRASWGQSGSVSSIGNYEAFPTISTGTTVYNGTRYPTSWISGITDDSRTWETVNTTNIGLDYGFFKNRLSGTFDYFWRKNNGMLINITYPAVYGGSAPSTNSGEYKTHGWEFTIQWQDNINKDWSYNAAFSLSNAKTEVTSYKGKNTINWGGNKIVEGKPLNALYVFKTEGLFQNQEEVDAYYKQMNGKVSASSR